MRALVTGAAGFTGSSLVKALALRGYEVDAIVRPQSKNNGHIAGLDTVNIVEINLMEEYRLSEYVSPGHDVAFHLACVGERYDFNDQFKNVEMSLRFIDELKDIDCKRIVCSGSQAEYGVRREIIHENLAPNPFCPYGAAKVATCYLSKNKAEQLGIEWVWARIFSLYGENEPENRMLPWLINSLKQGEKVQLSSCRQNWDYLNVRDGADALIALSERGKDGEIYNIASGDYRPLKEYVETVEKCLGVSGQVEYGDDPNPFVSLQPDVSKIKKDTGWKPRISFEEGIRELI